MAIEENILRARRAEVVAELERLVNEANALQRAEGNFGNRAGSAEFQELSARIRELRSERTTIDRQLASQLPPVVPPPPQTAGQIANDDATNSPNKPPALEIDPNTGRVRAAIPVTVPSNADVTPTAGNGDVDANTNGRLVSTSVTQAETTQLSRVLPVPPINNSVVPGSGGTRPTPPGTDSLFNRDANATLTSSSIVAPIAPGVAKKDDGVTVGPRQTATDVNSIYNNSAIVQPQSNILDQFGSYTYSISVYLMNPQQYASLIQSKTKTVSGYNLLFQSAGAPVAGSSAGNPGAGRNPYFGDDFYIDSLSLSTLYPGNGTMTAHSASEFKMTVIEPAGITFLDRLYQAVQDFTPKDGAGAVNYTAVQYLMVIRWYGWDLDGKLIKSAGGTTLSDPNAVVEKFIPFIIRKINWGVSNKLVTYELDCAPIGMILGSSTSRGTIPYDIELSDGTVKGLLTGDPLYNIVKTENTTSLTAPAPGKANSAPSTKRTIRQGLMGAMNDFQKKLVSEGKYEVADEYELVFANGAEFIADASITKPENVVKNLSATPMAPPVTKDASGLDPNRVSVDSNVRNYAVTAGQQIVQVLDLVLRNSTYVTDQARVVNQEETEIFEDELGNVVELPKNNPPTANIIWHNITMTAVPIKYDKKRNDYAYKITYIINPYKVQNFDSKYFPIPKFGGIHKSYKYWWTGENTGVLDYQVTFNHLYNMTVSGSEPGNSATDRLREQRSSSMRDIAKYVYQARSTESSQGAKGSANEISANAAEYLYSPKDLAESKLKIVGDPAWIAQGSMSDGVNPTKFNYLGFNSDGTINFDSQQVLFEVAWQRPRDYNLGTGLADPYEGVNGAREPIQSNIFIAKKCVSEFRQGRFEQTIDGSIYVWPIPSGQNTPATKPVSVSVNSSGVSDRAAGTEVTKPADLQIPGSGPISAPLAVDAVNLQTATATAATNLLSDAVQRQENSTPVSNGEAVGVNLPAPKAITSAVTPDGVQAVTNNNGAVTFRGTQLIRVSP